MLFGDLKPGDKFIYQCAVPDGQDGKLGIATYMKLEYPVTHADVGDCSCCIPQTAVSLRGGHFMATSDDTKILLVRW